MADREGIDMSEVSLRLTTAGPGSRPEIIEYVRTVIDERTTPHDDTTAEELARAITTSVLSRLGAGYSVAVGDWPKAADPDALRAVVHRRTLECGHISLTGPWDDTEPAPMIGDLTSCEICPKTTDPQSRRPTMWVRRVVRVEVIPGELHRLPGDELQRARMDMLSASASATKPPVPAIVEDVGRYVRVGRGRGSPAPPGRRAVHRGQSRERGAVMAHITADHVRELDAAGDGHAIVVRGGRVDVEAAGHECLRWIRDDPDPDRRTIDGVGWIIYSSPEMAEESEESFAAAVGDDEDDWAITDEAAEEIADRLSQIAVPELVPLTGAEIVAGMLGIDPAEMPGWTETDCVYCGVGLDASTGLCGQCDPH